jgi:hypothetical protein
MAGSSFYTLPLAGRQTRLRGSTLLCELGTGQGAESEPEHLHAPQRDVAVHTGLDMSLSLKQTLDLKILCMLNAGKG